MRDTREVRRRNNKIILITAVFILALGSISSFMGETRAPLVIDLGDSIYDVANHLKGLEEHYTMGKDWLELTCTPQSAWLTALKQNKAGYYAVGFEENKVVSIAWYDQHHVLQKENLLMIHCARP